ncbi:MAG TPA: hypothetical protein V6C69_00210 [Trichormus sp.]|jgi:hypothetical protein
MPTNHNPLQGTAEPHTGVPHDGPAKPGAEHLQDSTGTNEVSATSPAFNQTYKEALRFGSAVALGFPVVNFFDSTSGAASAAAVQSLGEFCGQTDAKTQKEKTTPAGAKPESEAPRASDTGKLDSHGTFLADTITSGNDILKLNGGEDKKPSQGKLTDDNPNIAATVEAMELLRKLPEDKRAEVAEYLQSHGMPDTKYGASSGTNPDRFQFKAGAEVSVPKYLNGDLQKSADDIIKSISAGDLKAAAAKFTDISPDNRSKLAQNIDFLLPEGKQFRYENGFPDPPSHITLKQKDKAGGSSEQTIPVPLSQAEQKEIKAKQDAAEAERKADIDGLKNQWFDAWAKENGIKPENKESAKAKFEKQLESQIKQDALSITNHAGKTSDDSFKNHLHAARKLGGNPAVDAYANMVSDYLRDNPPAAGPASVQIVEQSQGSDEQIEEARANGMNENTGEYSVTTTGTDGEKKRRQESF